MPKIIFKTTENRIYVGDLMDSSNSEIRVKIDKIKNPHEPVDEKIPDYMLGCNGGYKGTVNFNKTYILWSYTYDK